MTRNDLYKEVHEVIALHYGRHLSLTDVKKVIDEALAAIIATTIQGESVRLTNFGEFRPSFQTPHLAYSHKTGDLKMSRPYVRICFRSSKSWRLSLQLSLNRRRMKHMEKYGYEPEKKDPKVKEASDARTCPVCGEKLGGQPPTCPVHGSEPFERRETNGF